MRLAAASMLDSCGDVLQLGLPEGDPASLRAILDTHFQPSDLLAADHERLVPRVFVSAMDSPMFPAEVLERCVLARFASKKAELIELNRLAFAAGRAAAERAAKTEAEAGAA